MSTIRYILRV